jgi:hypothetical protein
MKFLLPVARCSLADCQRMAVLVSHRFTTRQAGQLYVAWRDATAGIRQRILQQPELFLKAQQQVDSASADELGRRTVTRLRDGGSHRPAAPTGGIDKPLEEWIAGSAKTRGAPSLMTRWCLNEASAPPLPSGNVPFGTCWPTAGKR